MLVKNFLKRSFALRAGSEKLKVCRHSDGSPLTGVTLRKTYFSPTDCLAVFELDFGTPAQQWTLEGLTMVLLHSGIIGVEINVDKCAIGGNATDKWIEV